jgi:hypothetical protein
MQTTTEIGLEPEIGLERETEMPPVTEYDPLQEFAAMGSIAETLKKLPEEARGRVLEYMMKLFAKDQLVVTKAAAVNAGREEEEEEEPPKTPQTQTFDDFPALFAAAAAETRMGTERALLAGYYLQVVMGESDFDAFNANRELRHVGYEASNITRDFDNLMSRTPAYMLQTKKLGSTKQARKQYRLTHAGIKAVEEMLKH